MKVDFRAEFKEISKLLKVSAEPQNAATGDGEFEELLSSLAPENSKEKKAVSPAAKNAAQVFFEAENSPPRARFHPELPEPKLPLPELASAPPGPADSVKDRAATVKTPTIVSARRINDEGENDMRGRLAPVRLPGSKPSFSGVHQLIQHAGEKHGVDPALGLAIANAESGLDPKAVSSDGHESKGVFQLLDTTGKHLLEKAGLESRYDPFNPELNVDLGVGYLRHLHDIFSRASQLSGGLATIAAANSSSLEKLAVAAFNAGEGRVASAQRRAVQAGKDPGEYDQISPYLPGSTQEYVTRVLALRDRIGDTNVG